MNGSPAKLFITALLFGFRFAAGQTSTPESQASRELVWREYVYANDGFAITLPDAPNPHKDTQLESGTAYTIHLSGGTTLTLHVGNFQEGCATVFREHLNYLEQDIQNAKASKATGVKQGYRTDVSSVRHTTTGSFPAVEYEQDVVNEDGTFRFYQRVQCVDKRLYIMGAIWRNTSSKPTDLSRVLSSFRLIGK